MAKFSISVVHVLGIENVVADALSRPSPEPVPVFGSVSVPTASSLAFPCLTPTPSALSLPFLSDPILSAFDFRCLSALHGPLPQSSR